MIEGGYTYQSGTGTATVSIPANARVLQFSARGGASATMQIDSGDVASVYPSFSERPESSMQGPFDIVFTDVDAFYVSWVQ
ncbi:hypothetical protein [Porticoccus sp.]